MSFDRRLRRGDVLRNLVQRLDQPDDRPADADLTLLEQALEAPGVHDTFADGTDLVAALLLRWHARLSSSVDRELSRQPGDLPGAVARAWARAAADVPGLRRLLDEQTDRPVDAAMASLTARARDKELARLAYAAGLGAGEGARVVAAGARVERLAREQWSERQEADRARVVPAQRVDSTRVSRASSARLARRIRALIPA